MQPYNQVLKFGFDLIMIAVVEFSVIYIKEEEADLTKLFFDVHTFLFCSVLLYFSKIK